MKMTLIGHFCVDILHRSDGSEERVFGGIYHAVAALATIAGARDTLYPVFGVGAAEIDEVKKRFGEFGNVDESGIFILEHGTNYVHYFDDQPNERVENVAPQIPFDFIKNFLAVDGIYINMISGNDISLETLDRIRLEVRSKRVPIHFDAHCLTLGVNPDGTRFRRAMSDWRRWCFMTDSVQMNEEEAEGMTLDHETVEAFAKHMMPLMVKAFVITRGKRGASVFQEQHKELKCTEFSEGANETPVSVVGSGDIFGASFLFGFLKKKNYLEAARFAQSIASYSTRFSLSEKHRALKAVKETL